MKIEIIDDKDAEYAKKSLNEYYKNDLIPAEKKTYLTNLKSSIGPYMGIEGANKKTKYLQDAASQIATLGLGFNPTAFFGVSRHIESWLSNESSNINRIKKSYDNFLNRQLHWPKLFSTICHSGSEANEIALGYCYQNRLHKDSNKVLAFEGSFHGRMMVALSSTWNKSKREPFEWSEYKTQYVKYPETKSDQIHRQMPANWKIYWENNLVCNDIQMTDWLNEVKDYEDLNLEIETLNEVSKKLKTNSIFAIIIEPMQCEGGDRYSTDRFHTALNLLAKSYKVPIIYDEVQTGFHLGKKFFWSSDFNLTDSKNRPIYPAHITCAKKAQTGIVLSHENFLHKNEMIEEYSKVSMIRGYYHALSLGQVEKQISTIEELTNKHLKKLVNKYSKHIHSPRVRGISFAIDLFEEDKISEIISKRFDYGLLYYPAGSHTLRFRTNTSYTENDLVYLFDSLDDIFSQIFFNQKLDFIPKIEKSNSGPNLNYSWHNLYNEIHLKLIQQLELDINHYKDKVKKLLDLNNEEKFVIIDKKNFHLFKDKIIELEKNTYEPTRQTHIDVFLTCINDNKSVCLAIESDNELIGIAFAAPMKNFPLERGLRRSPNFKELSSLYIIDTTINKNYQGRGFGKNLKYALYTYALLNGHLNIQGRNRDILASQMLNINISLGAFELFYIEEDYPDFEENRNVYFYNIDLRWKTPQERFSNHIFEPIGFDMLSKEFMAEQLPYLVNKVCLSNFVSERFLGHIKKISNELPQELRHIYTASGQSECVDKIVKSLSYNNKKKKMLLTLKGSYFGSGSFLSRSLSYDDEFFEVKKVESPSLKGEEHTLNLIEKQLKTKKFLAVFLEPVMQRTGEVLSFNFLRSIKSLSKKYNVELIYNETGSNAYRYSNEHFFASNIEEILPTAGFSYLGGQAGICFIKQKYFIEKPLMMISTWDGDEASFANYALLIDIINKDKQLYRNSRLLFDFKLIEELSEYGTVNCKNGRGYFQGNLPYHFQEKFSFIKDRYIIDPSYSMIKNYLGDKYERL